MEKVIAGKHSEINKEGLSEMDQKLLALVESYRNKIRIVGVGGSGCNTITRMSDYELEDTQLIATNTDAQSLLYTIADKKILLGKGAQSGRGAGGDHEVGEKCAVETVEEVRDALKGAKIVFLTTGLGGGTGTGAAPIVAQAAKMNNSICVAIVTLPFKSEGAVTNSKAMEGIKRLSQYADTILVMQNNKLLDLAPNLPLNRAFGMVDEHLAETLKGLIDLVLKPGVVNQDLANLTAMFREAGLAVMGVGDSSMPSESERILEATENALRCPLLEEADLTTVDRVLINISASRMVTLETAKDAINHLMGQVAPRAGLFWGVQLDERMDTSQTRITIVACGVRRLGKVKLDSDGRMWSSPIREGLVSKKSGYVSIVSNDPLDEIASVEN